MRQNSIHLFFLATIRHVSCFGFHTTAVNSRGKASSILRHSVGSLVVAMKEVDDATNNPTEINTQTALSMTIEQLEEVLGGWGRARLAWDCYSNGVDPQYLFGSTIGNDPSSLAFSSWNEYAEKQSLKQSVLPTPRVTQPLGNSALSLLSGLHSHCRGTIENGLATLVHISTASDGTTKLLLRLVDGFEVETVLIPFWAKGYHNGNAGDETSEDSQTNDTDKERTSLGRATRYASLGRTTVCISSQVGCKQGCSFCATGRMGKLRSLTADEILVQLFYAKKIVRLSRDGILDSGSPNDGSLVLPPVTNIVFMGMGEPADNAQSVRDAIEIMTRRELFQLGANRVTVSTVAPTPEAFMEFCESKCVLAWSVHAVRDDLRKKLVPTTKYTMEELRQGLIDTLKKRNLRTVMIEVALIADVNDSLREADELADFVKYITVEVPGSKLICNLIPYNDIGGGSVENHYRKPSMERILAFQRRLQDVGVYSHVRGTRGDEESAACGQLATTRKKKMELVG
ncbi:hypothetical protein HJC23_013998 [Cyclotella cryptica]|uniref:Radical SAM core domain-containing protein n=1 Tax=Cyclotella cryptica TaxID=29204 RepID=A0ABD3NGS0_9STRA|eukprot:CCRYP_021012-RB/>CCRYP_021012-RB protein AED:0.05 eAED:0.05 QI:147/1/1/1/1/1/3/132/513